MRYFNEDEKLKELRVIFEAMETAPIDSPESDVDLVDPLEVSQNKTDDERKRREADAAAIKKSEKKVNPFDFGVEKAELEDKIRKLDNSIQFMSKQMETEVNPEDKQEYPGIIQGIVDTKNVLLTRLKIVAGQAATQASVVSSVGGNKTDSDENIV